MANDDRAALERRIAELEHHVGILEERWTLNDAVDEIAEIAVRDRLPLDHAMRLMMPKLCESVGATVAWIRTYDETLNLHDYVHGTADDATLPVSLDEISEATKNGSSFRHEARGSTVIAQGIDVAGDPFGTAAVLVPGALDERARDRVAGLLNVFCEEVDNTLASIALARRKTLIIEAISNAFREPVLDVGLSKALDVMLAHVRFEDMLLVFRHEDDLSGRTLRYKILKAGVVVHDSVTETPDGDIDTFLRSRSFRMMAGDDDDVRERFGIRRYREEVLITGVRSTRVIGRVVVSSQRGEFNTFDRDLLDRFADSLRQRIVDFNREWKQLSTSFARDTCERLLQEESYREKYLTARNRECAVMFCDISGFTRVCEQVLIRPERIGQLIDTWSTRVVEIVWETGGVFDKMVGDCIIGIWGPPFFDRTPADLCNGAIDASRRIREFTRSLSSHEDLPELAGMEIPLDVATGLHWCPLFVGIFGPDEDYTGFSAGMNNAARLQGQAKAGEILCMETLVTQVGADDRFEPAREASVKNVAHPLRFRSLKLG